MAHLCHWPDCKTEVHPKLWGCPKHWFTLPLEIRRHIWQTYRPGQEEDKKPSDAYVTVANMVQAWIRDYLARKAINDRS